MKFEKIDRVPSGLTPGSDVWDKVEGHEVTLVPVPVNSVDTSKYVRDTVSERDIGVVEELEVRGFHDGESVSVKMSWRDGSCDDAVRGTGEFADKASVAFPVREGASIMTMGSERAPLNAWYWRADRGEPYDVLAKGFGDTERREGVVSGLRCSSEYDDSSEEWQVVFIRPLDGGGDGFVDLTPRTEIAFAVWEGSNGERGPLKSYSGEFRDLVLGGFG